MKRVTLALVGLGIVLLIVIWYMLVFTPRSDALAETEDQIANVQSQQAVTRSRIAALQQVREQAPQLQAELAAAESLLPRDAALPSALRQLQQAADAAGATLLSVSPSRPALVEGEEQNLYALALSVQIEGGYFQIVDLLRRLEDPAITPRGMTWSALALSIAEAPELTATLSGRTFAILADPPAPGTGDSDPEVDDGEPDVEVDVDVDVDTEADQ